MISKMEKTMGTNPFFSIGVTTYNRIDLLKQLLVSIISQDFTDFEIIIGNDFIAEPLSFESIGISDSRIRIINNDFNIGERKNMNSILQLAKGKYFTWIFDDDLCNPLFLSKVHSSLERFNYPLAVYTSFKYFYGTGEIIINGKNDTDSDLYSGKEFLRKYLSGSIRALGFGGFYDTEYLKSLGGAKRLTEGHMALYSEYLLLVQAGLLDHIAYLNFPMVLVRVHNNAWSSSNSQIELFKQAGISLINEAVTILSEPGLREDFEKNLKSLIKSVLSVIFVKSSLGSINLRKEEVNEYISSIKECFNQIEDRQLHDKALVSLRKSKKIIPLYILKAKIKKLIPDKYMGFVHFWQNILSRFTDKSF